MTRLTLTPPATWQKKVDIPVPAGTASVRITFRRRDLKEMQKFVRGLDKMVDTKAVLAVAEGWDLDDPFNATTVEQLCTTYPGAGHAIVQEYLHESTGRRYKLQRISDLE